MTTRLLLALMFLASIAWQKAPNPAPLVPFEKGGKWGYQDSQGNVVIPPLFALAQDFSPEGLAAVVDDAGWAYINGKGEVIIRPFVVDNGPDYFREGLARFTRQGKIGFFDRSGHVIIAPKFDFAAPFSEGLAAFCRGCREVTEGEHRIVGGGKWGFANQKGEVVVAARFDEAKAFQDGRARVKLEGKWGYIDKGGRAMNEVLEITEKPQEAVLIVSFGWTGGMGEAVLDPKTDTIRFFRERPIFVDSELVRKQLEGKLPKSWTGSLRVCIVANIQLVSRTARNPSIPGAPRKSYWEVQINKLHEIHVLLDQPQE